MPHLYAVSYHPDGILAQIEPINDTAPPTVVKRILPVMPAPTTDFIVPFSTSYTTGRAGNHARLHARLPLLPGGNIYRPVRERKSETVMELARRQIGCTGYDEVSLLSLSTGDYSEVHALVPQIIREMEAGKVSVSLPSLRVDSELVNDLSVMQTVRKAGLTFAPEAGTQRLRDVINKNVTEDDILRATLDAFSAGWNSVKLYFMIGLPTETLEDVEAIVDLSSRCFGWAEIQSATRPTSTSALARSSPSHTRRFSGSRSSPRQRSTEQTRLGGSSAAGVWRAGTARGHPGRGISDPRRPPAGGCHRARMGAWL